MLCSAYTGQALTSKWDALSRKGASVPNQALLDRDLLSWSDHIKRCLGLARLSTTEGQENRAKQERTGKRLVFRQVVIILA